MRTLYTSLSAVALDVFIWSLDSYNVSAFNYFEVNFKLEMT